MVAVSPSRRSGTDAVRPIDRRRPIAIYQQLKTILLEEIVAGRYDVDEQLPTEHDLCAQHGISRAPVHRALSELAEEGVILRHRRRGSYVNPHWLRTNTPFPELRLIVPEGPWEAVLRAAADSEIRLNVAVVDLEDLHQVLVRAVAEGRGPDVAVIDSVRVREFATAGFLRPLDELAPRWVDSEYRGDFLEPLVAGNSFDGDVVAVPAEADVAGLWFRRDVLADAGLDVPRTWADLAAAARAVADRGMHAPVVLPGGSRAGESTSYCLLALLATNGVAVIEDGAVTLDCAGALEGMSFLRTLVDDGLLAAEVASYDADRPIRQLAHGHAAFCLGGSYEAPALQLAAAIAADEVSVDFGFAPLPPGRGTVSPRSPAGWSTPCSARRPVRNWRCASSSAPSRRTRWWTCRSQPASCRHAVRRSPTSPADRRSSGKRLHCSSGQRYGRRPRRTRGCRRNCRRCSSRCSSAASSQPPQFAGRRR